ncbi:unnamed protein product, partial [Meganyctiphanes norvegica]
MPLLDTPLTVPLRERWPPNHIHLNLIFKELLPEIEMESLYCMVRVIPDQLMMHGGTTDVCGSATLMSIGKLGVEENKLHAKNIYASVEKHLGIPSNRMYITFTNKPSSEVGFKGTTFHDIIG